MTAGIAIVAAAGALATAFTSLAAKEAVKRGRTRGVHGAPSVWLWSIITAYMAMFTLLRFVHLARLPGIEAVFYAQTVAGALTVIALSWILLGVAFGHDWSRPGAEGAAIAAAIILTLVFTHGLVGPHHDAWSIEFLPASTFARYAIFAVYVAMPVVMSGLAVYAMREEDAAFGKKMLLFSTAVVLIFVPNAIKYVTFVEGTTSMALAIIMMFGSFLGWRSYHAT